ncbi:MAG: hypothetical protein QNL62_08895 [Gammaproteobacteria bacterium]|nr:hypothetical protein [Gammaproteobacteria bacterium]
MSQHFFDATLGTQNLRVQIGWDKPMQWFYCVVYPLIVEDGNTVTDEPVYSNLYEDNPKQCDLNYFLELLLERFEIKLPEDMIECVKQDQKHNIVNRGPLFHTVESNYSKSFWL